MQKELLGAYAEDYSDTLDMGNVIEAEEVETVESFLTQDTYTALRKRVNHFSIYNIHEFRFEKFDRQVNHIIAYLDRLTLPGRICKNDPDIRRALKGLSLASINDLIDLAQKRNAHNSLAVLMDYKNDTFGTGNLSDEFSL